MHTLANTIDSTTPASGASKYAPLFVAYVKLYAAIYGCRNGLCTHRLRLGYCRVYQFLIEVSKPQTKTV